MNIYYFLSLLHIFCLISQLFAKIGNLTECCHISHFIKLYPFLNISILVYKECDAKQYKFLINY
jgi:hypothetical protein